MSFLDDLESPLISSDMSTKSTEGMHGSFYDSLENSLFSSDLKSSSEEKPSKISNDDNNNQHEEDAHYFSSIQSPYYVTSNTPEKKESWKQEESLSLVDRRHRYHAKKILTVEDIETWNSSVAKITKPPSSASQFSPVEELNQKVAIWHGDITTLEIDAIVNAANESLLGGGGVDGVIHKAAGSKLLEECKTLGGANTGETKITRGYDLPAKYVLHAVGPLDENPELLSACYLSCLELLDKHKIKTVAFCCISTGVFGFPLEPSARIALDTVRKWLDTDDNKSKVKLIIFCVYKKKEKECYENLMFEYFPHSKHEEKIKQELHTDNENKELKEHKAKLEEDKRHQEEQLKSNLCLEDEEKLKKKIIDDEEKDKKRLDDEKEIEKRLENERKLEKQRLEKEEIEKQKRLDEEKQENIKKRN